MEGKHLTILQLNDSHGYFESHPELFWEGGREAYRNAGGYARISTLFKRIRDERRESVIALDNGDTIHGTFAAVHSRGEKMVPVLNHLAFDGMTAHWEFAYGPDQFERIVGRLDYPMLAINCYRTNDGELAFPPYTVIERNGLRIGVIGIAATIVDKTMPAHFSGGLRFTLGRNELPEYISELRGEERVDLVVVLSHLGYPQELQLAEDVDGIDVLLSGHTHNRLHEAVVVNGAIVIQSGCHGSFIGRLDLEVSDRGVKGFRHELVTVEESIEPNPAAEDMIDRTIGPHRDELEAVVGRTKTPLNRSRVLESTMDKLLLESIKEYSGAELAFSNGWRYGAPILPGPITTNDVWDIVPTNPPVSVCELTGEALWRMMEENLEHTFSRNPYMQMGGYVKRCFGLNIYFKVENPEGKRIHDLFVGGKRLDKRQTYSTCFLTTQGVPAQYGSKRENLDVFSVDV
ncbi:MAG: bifunctional metallophosphatase/5'-nucleotidase, partial [Candidatus Bathyarchaeota archaeon]|nr:bifunctional metallophosphatase/5'-nucleotidase [Candidatus Bathyarchaeota archaeon]